jgi:hypothetical protein
MIIAGLFFFGFAKQIVGVDESDSVQRTADNIYTPLGPTHICNCTMSFWGDEGLITYTEKGPKYIVSRDMFYV